jgi:Raf kinase inhibitor-like YbhB/YbcL family protein
MRSIILSVLALSLSLGMVRDIEASPKSLKVSSASFSDGGTLTTKQVFNGFGCEGENLSPQVSWSGVAKEAKSLALTLYDPDAPTGSGWWHWTLVNLPTSLTSLTEGASTAGNLPSGSIQGRTDYGTAQFGGACPPVGDKPHRYVLTVYALDVEKIDVSSESSGALVGYYLNAHAVQRGVITGMYGREKKSE